jgi:glycosyltransferase involved in cell wall biosynthesis
LVIVGGEADPGYYRQLRSEIARLDLADVVAMVGEVGHEVVVDHYRRASAFVFPSYLEAFGHPLLEAMSAAVPVAASNIPVFREVAGDAAVYFDPFDPADIAAKMMSIDCDAQYRRRLAKSGAARGLEFSWQKTAARTVEVFEAAASGAPRTRV